MVAEVECGQRRVTGFERIARRCNATRPRRLRGIAGDRRGSAAIEFAFIAAPFFALIIAIFQITMTFFAQQALETASDKAVRQLVTGAAQKSAMSQAQFKTLACSKLPSFMKCANLLVDVRTAASFAAADTSQATITYDSNGNPTNSFTYAPGQPGDITISRLMYVWSVQIGPLGFNLANSGSGRRLLTATAVFKTEPYQ